MRDDDDAFERKLNWFSKHSLLYHKISYAPLQTFSTFIRHGGFSKLALFMGQKKMGQTESTHTYISSSILWYVWKCFPLSVTTQLQEPYQKTIAGRISVEIFSKSMYYLCNFQFLTLFSGKMLPHEDIGIKVPFVQLLQVCLGKGEHSDQFP